VGNNKIQPFTGSKKISLPQKINFSGTQASIRAWQQEAAGFEGIANQMFARAGREAAHKGAEAGKSAIALQPDGTVTRQDMPDAGDIYTENFERAQRQAHLSAINNSMREKANGILAELQFNPDRDNQWETQFTQKVANTFIASSDPDIQQAVQFEAEMLRQQGANKLHGITLKEEATFQLSAKKQDVSDSIAKIEQSALTGTGILIGKDGKVTVSDEVKALYVSTTAKVTANVGRGPTDFTPEQAAAFQKRINISHATGVMAKILEGQNHGSVALTKTFQKFINSSDDFYGQKLSRDDRQKIVANLEGDIAARNAAYRAEKADAKENLTRRLKVFEADVLDREALGSPMTPYMREELAKRSGLNPDDPTVRLTLAELNFKGGAAEKEHVKNVMTIAFRDDFNDKNLHGMWTTKDAVEWREKAKDHPSLVLEIQKNTQKYFSGQNKGEAELDAQGAKTYLEVGVEKGSIGRDRLRDIWSLAMIKAAKGENLTPVEIYITTKGNYKTLRDGVNTYENRSGIARIAKMRRQIDSQGGPQTADQVDFLFKDTYGNQHISTAAGQESVARFVVEHNRMPRFVQVQFNKIGGVRSDAGMVFLSGIYMRTQQVEKPDPAVISFFDGFGPRIKERVAELSQFLKDGSMDPTNLDEEQDKLVTTVLEGQRREDDQIRNGETLSRVAGDVQNHASLTHAFLGDYENLGSVFTRFSVHNITAAMASKQGSFLSEALRASPAFMTLHKRIYEKIRRGTSNDEVAQQETIRVMSRITGLSDYSQMNGLDSLKSEKGWMAFPPEQMISRPDATGRRFNIGAALVENKPVADRMLFEQALISDPALSTDKFINKFGTIGEIISRRNAFWLLPVGGSRHEAAYKIVIRSESGELHEVNRRVVINEAFGRQVAMRASIIAQVNPQTALPRIKKLMKLMYNEKIETLSDMVRSGRIPNSQIPGVALPFNANFWYHLGNDVMEGLWSGVKDIGRLTAKLNDEKLANHATKYEVGP